MGIVFGYVSLICFLFMAVKAITHRCNWKKADGFLMRFHKLICGLLIISCFMHVILVSPVLGTRNIFVIITGIASVAAMILLIIFCHMIREKDKKMLWHRVLTIIMGLCIVGHIVVYAIDFNQYQKNVSGITFENVDLKTIQDGIYEGEYDAGYIYAKVEVEIINGEIVFVDLLEHRNERGKAAEKVLNDIIAENKVDVDAVTGATNSSNVIKKAVENAIRSSYAGG